MRQNNYLPIQIFAACLVGLLLGKFGFSTTSEKVELSLFNGKPSKLQSIINIIDNRYVDKINIDSLNELIIPSILEHLDPHSTYIPAQKLNEAEKNIIGQFCGVGIEFNIFNDTATVLYTYPNGPAKKAGVLAGDQITKIDTIDVTGPNARSMVVSLLKGDQDSKVNITVKRTTSNTPLKITIVRGNVDVYSVSAAYIIDSTTAYIKIASFGDNVYKEFMNRIIPLQKQGIENLLIDLRNNRGGRVEQVKRITSEILNYGDTIAFTVNRNNKVEETLIDTTTNGICRKMKIICLVNSQSASASEIMSAAIQDNDRGLIVGRRTFGKGLVQTPIQLSDGSQLRLTTLRYYTPSGRSLQKGYSDYTYDMSNRIANGELDSANAYILKDSTVYKTRNGRIVYSKGGVQPDIFVPEHKSDKDKIIKKLDSLSVFNRYAAIKYNNSQIDDSTNNALYINALLNNKKKTVAQLIEYAKSLNIPINPQKDKKDIDEAKEMIMALLISYAYHIIGDPDEYCRYSNYMDSDIEQAIYVIHNDSIYNHYLTQKTE
jgi:carboxyl-terminal processing protease